MKKIYAAVILIFSIGLLAMPVEIMAQNEEDIAIFLKAGQEDASKLIEAFVQPTVVSMSYGMAGGWFNTAKAHKTLGFDIGLTMNAAFIPTSDNYFNPNKLNLSTTTYDGARPNGSTAPYDPTRKAPTFFGPKDETQYTSTYDPDGDGPLSPESLTYNGPEGLNIKKTIGVAAVPAPMIQLGVGIFKNTDLKIRYASSAMVEALIPSANFKNSEFTILGFGIMHDIKQHINGIKLLPFDLSAMVAYNSVTGSSDLNNGSYDDGPVSDNGELDYKFNSWVIQGLISKKISVLTGYAGVGYSIVKTKVDVKGDYSIDENNPSFTLSDPVGIEFNNNSFRLTLGMRLKFGPFYLNGDYTLQKYNTLSLGLGFSVR